VALQIASKLTGSLHIVLCCQPSPAFHFRERDDLGAGTRLSMALKRWCVRMMARDLSSRGR